MLAALATARFWIDLTKIIGVNILLSGDNAVVIALASRSLSEDRRRIAVIGGSAAAIVLRIVFCLVVVSLMQIPYLKLAGGVLLLYIGVRLVIPEAEGGTHRVTARSNVTAAIWTILLADAVMSLDNVVAIAAAAHGSVLLIGLGLLLSIPLIVFGSQLVLRVLNRFPVLVTLGGGLLGWIAGEIIMGDPAVASRLPYDEQVQELIAKVTGAAVVLTAGFAVSWRARGRERDVVDLASE